MRVFFALFLPAVVLAACSPPPQIDADNAYVRLPAVKGNPAAAYFTLHGGPADTALFSVSSTVAIKAEMHESMKMGGAGSMAGMKPIDQVPLPADATLAFAPGGRHVMLFDMNPGIKPGSKVPLTFTFSNGLRFERNAIAIGAGDPAPEN